MKPLLYRSWIGSFILLASIGTLSFGTANRAIQRVIACPPASIPQPIPIGAQTWQHPTLWRSLPVHAENLAGDYRVALSPDGRVLVGGDRTALTLWDVETGEPLRTLDSFAILETDAPLSALQVSPDGRWVAAGLYESSSGSLRAKVWNGTTRELVNSIDRRLVSPTPTGPDGPQTFPSWASLAFSPDSKRLATIAAGHRQIDIWDLASGQPIQTLQGGRGLAIAFSPDGQRLARSDGERVLIWELANPTVPQVLEIGHDVMGLVFDPSNSMVYVAHRENSDLSLEVRRWHLATPSSEHLFSFHWSTQLTFSPSGTTLIAGSPSSPMVVADLQTGETLYTSDEYFTWSPATAFSQDGSTFAVTTGSQNIQVWRSGQLPLTAESATP